MSIIKIRAHALHHLRVIVPAMMLGIFFNLPHMPVGHIVATVVLAYVVAWVIARYYTMPNAWLHVLTVNVTVSMVLAIMVLIHALMMPFPEVDNWGNVILIACGIMFLFLVVFALATFLYWRLERHVYQRLCANKRDVF